MKFSLRQFITFAIITCLGIFVDHDVYQVFLGMASAMLAYAIAMSFLKRRITRATCFLPMAIIFCQGSVLTKKAIVDTGFRTALEENPFGKCVGDVFYGFKNIFLTVNNAIDGTYQAISLDQYTTIEDLNYRFMTVTIMVLLLGFYLLKAKPKDYQTAHE